MGWRRGLIMIEGGRSQSWRVWSTIPYITYETLREQISTIGSQTTHQRKIMNVGKEPMMRRWGTEERQRDDSGCITLTRAHLLLVELGFFLFFAIFLLIIWEFYIMNPKHPHLLVLPHPPLVTSTPEKRKKYKKTKQQ